MADPNRQPKTEPAEPATAPTKPSAAPADPTGNEAIKETLESVVIAFILAFVFRAYVVEAFVIPTGSMAPTLLGAHLRADCQQCGYRFQSDWPEVTAEDFKDLKDDPPPHHWTHAVCPMCHFSNPYRQGHAPSSGDRILVLKYIYNLREPRRWDVVVFKDPSKPDTNFIKRLVGLPNESLWIIEGNLYVKPADAGADAWRIARKVDRSANPHAELIQRDVWQPIYHSDFVPLDGGQPGTLSNRYFGWRPPWRVAGGAWETTSEGELKTAPGRGYRTTSAGAATLRFDFDRQFITDQRQFIQYPYNQLKDIKGRQVDWPLEPIEDVRLAVAVQPDDSGLSLKLRTQARLPAANGQDDPAAPRQTLELAVSPDGKMTLTQIDPAGRRRVANSATVDPIAPHRTTLVELWLVDQEASIWVDGRRVEAMDWRFEFPIDTLKERPPIQSHDFPKMEIELTGTPATLHRVDLDRDIYYSSSGSGMARAAIEKRNGRRQDGAAVSLGPDEFFCLGDNSPSSSDGRYWFKLNHWISQRMFDGRDVHGVVPRDLMMGRAFFVYFPTPLPLSHGTPIKMPNFGDMRAIH